jgi:two-component system, NtrC family, sensor kinase
MAGVISTIVGKCKRCYTCIRYCPAKAIKVEGGQAVVIEDRCIGCGTCYKVCAQQAKQVRSSVEQVQALLLGEQPVLACLAPSFPAVFHPARPGQVVSAARALGFAEVLEVAFGAELLGREYGRLAREANRTLISTPCPALVAYVEKYAPALLPNLVPLVSPMVALGRVIKDQYRPGAQVVFVGPCIAKKVECEDPGVDGAVDAVLTFDEFQQMLSDGGIDLPSLPETCFDGPNPYVARIFPVSGGLLRTAALQEDPLDNRILVTEGRENALQIVETLLESPMDVRFVDLLFCEGCIDGPVVGDRLDVFSRKEVIANYVRAQCAGQTELERDCLLDQYASVDLSRTFTDRSIRLPVPSEAEIREILRQTNKVEPEDELDCGACGYLSCREKAIAVYQGLAEAQMCLPYLIEQLQENVGKLQEFQRELQATQQQLIQSEKLASMGQLAAGVAHEINNPLGSILLYSDMMLKDLQTGSQHWQDLKFIVDEAIRCKRIVGDLLNFARQNQVAAQDTDLNAVVTSLAEELRAQPAFARVETILDLDPALPHIQADPSQLRQVFTNLMVNAAEAMPDGGALRVSTKPLDEHQVSVSLQDTGYGIPQENLSKLFTPFFTTKPIGKGTGLGLAIVYGIVKMHRGQIQVHSQVGMGTTFTVTLPVRLPLGAPAPAADGETIGFTSRYQSFPPTR